MLKYLFFFIFLGFFNQNLVAQNKKERAGALTQANLEKINTIEDSLAILAYAVVNDSLEMNRFGACRALIPALVRALKVENSFQYRFDRLKSMSIMAPPDSSFRIFTWQLFVNDSTYKYFGAIQMNAPTLKLFPLSDKSAEMENSFEDMILTHDNWYGSLYYNVQQFEAKEGNKYLLIGFDAFSFFERRKIIDVLSFDKTGKPNFGATVFDMVKTEKEAEGPAPLRLVLEYSAEAGVRCNFDQQYEMILFDHLEIVPSPFGRGMTQIPDGSVEGLKLEKGRWRHISKVFNDSQTEEQTQIEPILGKQKGKNMLGKQKKGKGY
jgi:hypothetical protein